MIFRQLFDSVSGTYTYLIASRHGGEALIIDPVLEKVDRYLQLVRELDLKLVKAVDTHLHADHITGLGALRDRTHCITVMGEQTLADVVSMRVTEGDRVAIEGLSLDVLYTPGHTDDSYSFLMGGRVFTGDTLLIRGTGRTDFQNGDPRQQYDSIFNKLLKLPDETLVYPAHDYKGDTVSHHRRGEAVQPAPAGPIGRRVCRPDEQPEPAQPEDDGRGGSGQHPCRPSPGRDRAQGLGRFGGRGIGAAAAVPTSPSSICARRRNAKSTAIIPGALHAPYPELPEHVGKGGMLHELATATGKRIVFYCAFGERSAMAVQAAQDAGLTTACHIEGGIDAWKKANGPVVR